MQRACRDVGEVVRPLDDVLVAARYLPGLTTKTKGADERIRRELEEWEAKLSTAAAAVGPYSGQVESISQLAEVRQLLGRGEPELAKHEDVHNPLASHSNHFEPPRPASKDDGMSISDAVEVIKGVLAKPSPAMRAMVEALEKARQFIVNGIECGRIRMPDLGLNDSAYDTLPEIEAALALARAELGLPTEKS